MKRTIAILTIVMAICLISTMITTLPSEADDEGQARIGEVVYPTVADALSSAKNGDTVIVFDGAVLKSNAIVKPGVTLLLPYTDGHGDVNMTGTEDNYHDYKDENTSSKKAGSSFCKCTFTVNKGVKLLVYGKVIVGGILSEAFAFDYQGHTSSFHAVLKLNGTMELKTGSQLCSYGYIRGSGSIQALSGSSVFEPFIVTDYIGGDNLINQYDVGQSPFNRYTFSNIECDMTIQYGSSLVGLANLYANKSFNKCEFFIIGKETDNALIKLKSGSYATITYDPNRYVNDNWESNIYKDVGLTTMSLSGGAEFGSIEISARGQTAQTSNTQFSIPYNLSYILSDGEYSITTPLRLLPGASMVVSSNSHLKIDGGLQIYEGLMDVKFKDKYYPLPETLESFGFCTHGRLVVNGSMTVAPQAEVLGVIECDWEGGTVTVESFNRSDAPLKNVSVAYGANHRAHIYFDTSKNLTTRNMSLWIYSPNGERTVLERGYVYTMSDGYSTSSYFVYYLDGKSKIAKVDQIYRGDIYSVRPIGEPESPNTVTVTYEGAGDLTPETVTVEKYRGERYRIKTPAIPGFEADTEAVEGVMGIRDVSVTVTYVAVTATDVDVTIAQSAADLTIVLAADKGLVPDGTVSIRAAYVSYDEELELYVTEYDVLDGVTVAGVSSLIATVSVDLSNIEHFDRIFSVTASYESDPIPEIGIIRSDSEKIAVSADMQGDVLISCSSSKDAIGYTLITSDGTDVKSGTISITAAYTEYDDELGVYVVEYDKSGEIRIVGDGSDCISGSTGLSWMEHRGKVFNYTVYYKSADGSINAHSNKTSFDQ